MKARLLIALGLAVVIALAVVALSGAVSGAAFTTFNPWVDGAFKFVCKNSIINCNIYGTKPDVWLNGGPAANGLGPDGQYFFAVLVPGGQPNPNDRAVGVLNDGDKNLSDDYDAYTNRTFTVTNGEVSYYGGTHDQDSGNFLDPNRTKCNKPRGCTPDGKPPLIRLYPYADTTNPGGVYILAICYIGVDGSAYPVEPRTCKYDAFKVKEVYTMSLRLSGMKFLDVKGDGRSDWIEYGYKDPGLEGWQITIVGTGFLGEAINETITTNPDGSWSFQKDYTYNKFTTIVPASLTVCEVLKTATPPWVQTYPSPKCYSLTIPTALLAEVKDLDFGNGQPDIDVDKTCSAAVQVGKPIDYDFDVTNTGNVTLVNVDVKDPTVGFDNSPNITLAALATQHYDWQITPVTPQVIKNTVYASGDYGATTVFATVKDEDYCTTNVVDARISIVQSDTNSIKEPHTFVVTLEVNPGTGWVAAGGVKVAVSETGVGEIKAETCTAGTDANGQCTVTVNSDYPGDSTVNASATVVVKGVTINVATDGYGKYIVSNVKTWVAGSLKWYKYDDKMNLLGGATFTVCRILDRFGKAVDPVECQDVTDPDGAFELTNLVLGTWTIAEKSAPYGYKRDPFVETIVLTLAAPDGVATHAWINIPWQGCTPGFWQGGNEFETAGGKWYWNDPEDQNWIVPGKNPYWWETDFCTFFGCSNSTEDMWHFVNPDSWEINDDFHKAARSLVAGYLNASWGIAYAYDTGELMSMWTAYYNAGKLAELHSLLDKANNAIGGCPISASIP